MIPVQHYLVVASILFAIGAMGFVLRRNLLVMFMSVELMLNAANLAMVAASRLFDLTRGSAFAIVSVAVAAAEVGVGLAIIIALFRQKATVDSENLSTLRG
jgi:NADH-quinone oxidoreductase subunit K